MDIIKTCTLNIKHDLKCNSSFTHDKELSRAADQYKRSSCSITDEEKILETDLRVDTQLGKRIEQWRKR